jgi:hypothetical protein
MSLLCPKSKDTRLHDFIDGTCPDCGAPRPDWPDWTVHKVTHRSNSAPLFSALCREVERIIRGAAHSLIAGRADAAAGLVMAQLAHRYGLVPRELIESEAVAKLKEIEALAEAAPVAIGWGPVLTAGVVLAVIRRQSGTSSSYWAKKSD